MALAFMTALASLLDFRSATAQPIDIDLPPLDSTEDPATPTSERVVPDAAGTAPGGVAPTWLSIPYLGVDARVVPVGLDDDGAMAAPTDPDEVGWYAFGPGMGIVGNVVLAGHVDWDGRLRVFGRLSALEIGSSILVIDAAGAGYEYVVEASYWVRAVGAPVDEIFAQGADPVITLITCGGAFDAVRREYLDRLIVRARGA